MKTFKNTLAYKNKVKEIRRAHGRGVPSFNFIINNHLHSVFVPQAGEMIYLISTQERQVESFQVKEVLLSTREYLGTLKTIIKAPIPNLWVVLEFDSFGGQIAYLAQDDWVEEFKRRNPYTTRVEDITPKLHELALKLS